MVIPALILLILAIALLLDNRQLRAALDEETAWRREAEADAMRGRQLKRARRKESRE